jgi:hypothetical protein
MALVAQLVIVEVMYRVQGLAEISDTMTIVNASAVGWFLLLTIFSRCCVSLANLVCPSLIGFVFYYIIWVEYDAVNISIFYKTVVGITITLFLVVIFNEAWFLTTLTYGPLVCYFMYISGHDMLGDSASLEEYISRCVFMVVIFAIIAYQIEKLNKQSFLGREASQQVFFKWLKIFDTFPEGLMLVRGNDIVYANESLSKLLELHEYVYEDDHYKHELQEYLRDTMVTKLDREFVKKISIWDFLDSNMHGGAYELNYQLEEGVPHAPQKNNFVPTVEGQALVKYLSLNKVSVNVLGAVSGKREKLFIVRDLTTMVNLQKVMYTRTHFNEFTEKIVREIQEATEISSMNIQELEMSHVDFTGKPIAKETQNEIRRVLFRIRDFGQVYNVVDGTFNLNEQSFSVAEEF